MPINKTLINFEEFVKDFVVLFEADAETRDITVKSNTPTSCRIATPIQSGSSRSF